MIKARRSLLLAFALLVVCALAFGIFFRAARAQRSRGAQSAGQSRPQTARTRLVLLIVVDQFRYDYLERFDDLFAPNGLRRLMRDGASWAEANYDHTPTYTAPGHATLMTGTWPSENGIVANNWFERETGKRVSSVTDDETLLLGGKEGEKGSSPRRLLVSTLGDELRLATNDRAKVIGISVKNRSAILPAGRRANAAYWFSLNTGNMVSSTYYFKSLPAWVERFNAKRVADKFYGARWDRLLPESEYLKRAGADAPAWEDIDTAKDTNTFPHIITGGARQARDRAFYKALDYAPFSNDLLVAFAKEALEHESLGADDDTDVLSVSFSANDYVGHRFGPYSQEAMDMTLRVDRQIAELLGAVDARVGLQHTLVVFTADHGVAPIPEQAAALNLPGRRIKKEDVLGAIKAAIKERYGSKNRADDYIQQFRVNNEEREGFINGNLYFNAAALKRDGVELEELSRVAGEAALTVAGTARYFTRAQLEAGSIPPADLIARRVLHGFHPQRSGDLLILYQPYSILFGDPDDPADPRDAATHGSPYSYDTHVPLMLMGNGLKSGRYIEAATPADIAPTLAALLGVQSPSNATGRVLVEGIKR
jgi:predicted AlkP superfamily pyrophosphatase or phosphodiesterase